MQLSIVIPAKNEAHNVEPLIREIRQAIANSCAYEIIVIDDGSTDDTLSQLLAIPTNTFAPLRVCQHTRSLGQSTAVLTGVRVAKAPLILTLDADGQNDPADIPLLLAQFQRPGRPHKLQLISGLRRKRNDNWLRRVSSRMANRIRSHLLKDHAPDTGCGIKLFFRDVFLSLPQFNHMHRFLPALVQRQGGVVEHCEVNHRPRRSGRSNYGVHNRLWVGIVDLIGVMWLQHRAVVSAQVKEY